jgi:hypothetical protein
MLAPQGARALAFGRHQQQLNDALANAFGQLARSLA